VSPAVEPIAWPRIEFTRERALVLLLVIEIALFSMVSPGFFSAAGGYLIVRLSAEVGLLALALTLVIVAGGIDLSVGSMMGLSAVLLGLLWRAPEDDKIGLGLPIELAVLLTLLAGAAAGGLNAFLIARLRLPPLIVTLGTFSLFRGLAEGLTRGADNFTGFPERFLFLGQGEFLNGMPPQLPMLLFAVVAFWLVLHRTTIGRGLYAIGLSPEGARYAGIPVGRRVGLVYILSGLAASAAGILYTSRFGQARADVGTGYELLAITAVVLGGTSIFGGRGTVHGTLLGLCAIGVMESGLRLAALPSELAGILVGLMLLTAICLERVSTWAAAAGGSGELKGSWQMTAVCAVVVGCVLIAAAGHAMTGPSENEKERITVAMMPKSKGNAYFIACRKGAMEAAQELGVNLIWDGPTDPDPIKQNELIETWIVRGVDVIAVSVENRVGISPALRKAREKGIKVVTWDADAEDDARDFFVNQATPEGIGQTLMDHCGRILGGKGEFAIIKASLTASNMIEWQKQIEKHQAAKYPDIKLAVVRPCDDLQKKAFEEAQTIMNAYPKVKLIMAICSPAVPGAAEAVEQSGRKDVTVIGLGLPNENKTYVHKGITECVVLWNTMDLGYLTVYASHALKKGTLQPDDLSLEAGRLGNITIQGDNILLGTPFTFTKSNIDLFDF